MGCWASKAGRAAADAPSGGGVRKLAPPPWRGPPGASLERLERERTVFWETAPAYGGAQPMWDALKAASELLRAGDPTTARLVLDSAGIVVARADLSVCFDERGAKYDLPNCVLADPPPVALG
jgi:hypothetical protein